VTTDAIDRTSIAAELEALEVQQQVPAGTLLFQEGEQPRGVYVIRSGRVDLVYSSKSGAVRPLATAVEGQILGMGGVVSGKLHDCTATAGTAATFGFVDRQALLSLLERKPALWFSVVQTISSDINSCWDCMRTITSANAR
jgi:CRP/FNR family transcriptional regulator